MTYRCTCVYLKIPHLLGVCRWAIEWNGNNFSSLQEFHSRREIKAKVFSLLRLLFAPKSNKQRLSVLLFTLAEKWTKMKIITKWTAFFRFIFVTGLWRSFLDCRNMPFRDIYSRSQYLFRLFLWSICMSIVDWVISRSSNSYLLSNNSHPKEEWYLRQHQSGGELTIKELHNLSSESARPNIYSTFEDEDSVIFNMATGQTEATIDRTT